MEIVRNDSQSILINRAQLSISRSQWELGECASIWSRHFASFSPISDFADYCEVPVDQLHRYRRVWDRFAGSYQNYPHLKWSHFCTALNWDDAEAMLQWADDVMAGIAEMKAYRRAQRGDASNVEEIEPETE